tara:strand:+ start:100 stop:279 length:180 start_codon:yes stop_codon:yes gene_type:complete
MEEYIIKITGKGTADEIKAELLSIIGGIEEAQEGEHSESAILDGAEWEGNTLATEISEA